MQDTFFHRSIDNRRNRLLHSNYSLKDPLAWFCISDATRNKEDRKRRRAKCEGAQYMCEKVSHAICCSNLKGMDGLLSVCSKKKRRGRERRRHEKTYLLVVSWPFPLRITLTLWRDERRNDGMKEMSVNEMFTSENSRSLFRWERILSQANESSEYLTDSVITNAPSVDWKEKELLVPPSDSKRDVPERALIRFFCCWTRKRKKGRGWSTHCFQ